MTELPEMHHNDDARAVRAAARIFVPDRIDPATALARTTELGIVAHPDDLELAMPGPILDCRDDPGRWFTGVVCTDGAGSLRSGSLAELTQQRVEEQIAAAVLGGYSAVVMLDLSSNTVRDPHRGRVLENVLGSLLAETSPGRVLTHNPLDRHPTHVAISVSVIRACRAGGFSVTELLGCEGWGGLDWLDHRHLVQLPVRDPAGALELAGCFGSQLQNKRYDIAAQGRRRYNATFAEPLARDSHSEVSLALDLTPTLSAEDPAAVLGELTGPVSSLVENQLRERSRMD